MTTAPCTCSPTGELDTRCPRHGLYGDVSYPPMNRHAREGETAATTQRRLYLQAAPDCVRVRAAGLPWPLRECPPRELGQR